MFPARPCIARKPTESVFPPQSSHSPISSPTSSPAIVPLPEPSAYGPCILIFGCDRTLLETRKWILARHGHVTSIATELAEVERALAENPVRLLILCYSLNALECARALALIRSRPAVRSLQLINGIPEYDPSGEVLNVFDGPEKLLSTVDRLLHLPSEC